MTDKSSAVQSAADPRFPSSLMRAQERHAEQERTPLPAVSETHQALETAFREYRDAVSNMDAARHVVQEKAKVVAELEKGYRDLRVEVEKVFQEAKAHL